MYIGIGRRLKALQDAVHQGMACQHVDAIVHNLDSKSLGEIALPFFCKFLDSWSTRNSGHGVDDSALTGVPVGVLVG